MCPKHTGDKGHTSRTRKRLPQLSNGRANDLVRPAARRLNGHFPREEAATTSTLEEAPHLSQEGNVN